MDGVQPVMDINRGSYSDGNFGLGGGLGIFAIFAIIALLGGGGIWGRNAGAGAESSVLEAVNLSNGQQTAQLEAAANQRENCSQFTATNTNISSGFANLARDLCTQSFGIVNTITGGFADVKDRLATMAAQNAQCCCDILRGIDSINFNATQNTSAIIRSQEAGTQKILDYLYNKENQRLRDENIRYYINSQFCGVPRFQPATVYGAIPFGGNGYGWNYGANGNCACGY